MSHLRSKGWDFHDVALGAVILDAATPSSCPTLHLSRICTPPDGVSTLRVHEKAVSDDVLVPIGCACHGVACRVGLVYATHDAPPSTPLFVVAVASVASSPVASYRLCAAAGYCLREVVVLLQVVRSRRSLRLELVSHDVDSRAAIWCRHSIVVPAPAIFDGFRCRWVVR